MYAAGVAIICGTAMIPPSMYAAPCFRARAARSRAWAGVPLVRLTRVLPVRSVSARASVTLSLVVKQTITSGLAATASVTVSAGIAPCAARGPVLAAERFQTVTGWPAFRRAAARALPIMPRPRTVTGGRGRGVDIGAPGGSF